MADFKPKWRKSIFGRMLIVFTLMIIPLYILSALIYNWAMVTVKREISNTMLSQVNFYLSGLENQVMRIKWLQFDCVNDENLRQLATIPDSLDDYDKTKAVARLQQRLVAIANSSEYIKNVKAYIPAINRTVTTTLGGYETSVNQKEFKAMDLRTYINQAQLIYWQNRLFLSVNYPVPTAQASDNSGKQPLFIISIELSRDALNKALQQFDSYKDGGALLIDNASKFAITSNDNREANEQLEVLISPFVKATQRGTETLSIHKQRYLVIYTKSDYLGVTMSRYIPENEVFKQLKGYYIWLWILTMVAVILVALYSLWTHQLIQKPLIKLVKSFGRMEKGDLNIVIEHEHEDEFRYLYTRFNEMVEKLKILIDQVYKQKILAQNAQLKQLQSQINPHFLYNSYFILHRMVTLEDNENAGRFSQQLGTYLKFITRSNADDVLLSREVEHARIYTDIQAMRFISRISVEFGQLPEECSQLYVPRLILQPIIENAFEHGLENKAQGGRLSISFSFSENCFDAVVEDNGDSMSEEELNALNQVLEDDDKIDSIENTGVINIHRRISYKFGKDSGIYFERSGLGGLKAVIRIVVAKRDL